MSSHELQSPTYSHAEKKNPKEDFLAYVSEGFDIPSHEQSIRDRLIQHMPSIKTKAYRQSLLKIVRSLSELDSFSNNIEKKVDYLLQAQETYFVQSYKTHIDKIKNEFEVMNKQIAQLQQKIRYYQNEGEMSQLVKKVFQLQQQSAKLYQLINAKDKRINDLELTIKVDASEIKRLQDGIRTNARQKSELLWRSQIEQENSEHEEMVRAKDVVVFPTELKALGVSSYQSLTQGSHQPQNHIVPNTLSRKSVSFDVQNSLHQDHSHSLCKGKKTLTQQQLYRQNLRLKVKNKKLVSLQTRVTGSRSEFEQFFINCVQQLKRQIRIRKKISYCSLQDFRKEDKLMLLIKILSNEEIVSYLHEKIFGRDHSHSKQAQNHHDVAASPGNKKLPKLSFNLHYQHQ